MNKTSIIDIAVLKEKVQEYAMKVGRICARPVKNFCIVSMVILFWVSLPISAQKEIKVSYPSKVCVGDIFNVSYFLETEGSEPDLRLVYNDDVYKVVEAPLHSIYETIINENEKLQHLKRLNVLFFKLSFVKEGVYNLPNIKVAYEPGHYIGYPINQKIQVVSHIDNQSNEVKNSELCDVGNLKDYLDVVATVDKQELTLGDSFECEYRVYTDIDVKEMSNNSLKIDNSFWYYTDSLKTKTMEIKRYKGMNSRSVLWAKLKITPLKAGKIVIPSMPFSAVYDIQDKSIDPMEAFFSGGGFISCDTLIYSNPLTVEVKDKKLSTDEEIWKNPEVSTNADCMVVLDRSSSLLCKDDSLKESYYELENLFMQKFIGKIKTDKIDVVAFAGRPSLLDDKSLRKSVMEIKHYGNNDGSAIYDGVLASVIRNRLYEEGNKLRSILLLTDGTDSSSRISASTLASFLQQYGVRLNVVAFASDKDSVFYKEKYFDGKSPYYTKIKNEQRFDDLKSIAKKTDGVFVQVRNKSQLKEAYKCIQNTLTFCKTPLLNTFVEFSFNEVMVNRLFQEIYKDSLLPL